MRKTDNKFHNRISGVLSGVVRDHGWGKKLDMHSVFLDWEKLVGETLAECTEPYKIVNNVLWIEVSTSSWMQQLQFDKLSLLETLNDSLKISRFNDIKFILPEHTQREPQRKEPTVRFVAPDSKELQEFEKQAGLIEDEKSRDALVRLWYLSKACKKE